MFLIAVDAFSKWPEVVQMSSTTATGTIKKLTRIFAQQGFPKVLVSDNGMQFTSQEFQSYCQQHGIQHIRSPPCFVDIFKRSFQKLRGKGATSDAIQKFLWTYRSTPCLSSLGQKTPPENCIGRQLRTPISDLQLQSHLQQEAMKGKAQQTHKVHRREFAEGDTVYLRLYEYPMLYEEVNGPQEWSSGDWEQCSTMSDRTCRNTRTRTQHKDARSHWRTSSRMWPASSVPSSSSRTKNFVLDVQDQ